MAWSPLIVSDALALTGAYQTVLSGGADMVVTLAPGEQAHIQAEYDPQATATEDAEIVVAATPDGIGYDADGEPWARRQIGHGADPARVSVVVHGVYGFRLRARLVDPDGTAGGDDAASLTVRVVKDGVSL